MGFGDMLNNLKAAQAMMKNENFRKLMANPKVQGLMKDPEFVEAMKSKNYLKLMSNPELKSLMEDPELREAMTKINPKDLGL